RDFCSRKVRGRTRNGYSRRRIRYRSLTRRGNTITQLHTMSKPNIEIILRRFEQPDEVRTFPKGRFEIVRLRGLTIGRATYEPGWKWSEDIGPAVGASHCNVEHIGMVLSGRATAAFQDGLIHEMQAGDLFYIPPVPHDSWV